MFIVFDGLDKCGKTTLAKEIATDSRVEYIKFPYYDCVTGRAIKEAFEKGGLPRNSLNMLFAANRLEVKSVIEGWLAQGKIVIADRYSQSGWAYSGATTAEIMDWVIDLDKFSIKPDIVFLFLEQLAPLDKDAPHEDPTTQSNVSKAWEELWDPTINNTTSRDIWQGVRKYKMPRGDIFGRCLFFWDMVGEMANESSAKSERIARVAPGKTKLKRLANKRLGNLEARSGNE